MKVKRMTVTILAEWERDFDKLKKEEFYNSSKSELIRYLIKTGLSEINKRKEDVNEPTTTKKQNTNFNRSS